MAILYELLLCFKGGIPTESQLFYLKWSLQSPFISMAPRKHKIEEKKSLTSQKHWPKKSYIQRNRSIISYPSIQVLDLIIVSMSSYFIKQVCKVRMHSRLLHWSIPLFKWRLFKDQSLKFSAQFLHLSWHKLRVQFLYLCWHKIPVQFMHLSWQYELIIFTWCRNLINKFYQKHFVKHHGLDLWYNIKRFSLLLK